MLTSSAGRILGMTEPRRSKNNLSPEGRSLIIMSNTFDTRLREQNSLLAY
jgi:hypothetical protein